MGLDVMLVGCDSEVYREYLAPRWGKIITALGAQNLGAEDFKPGECGEEEFSERIGSYGTLHLLRRFAAHLELEGSPPRHAWREDGTDPVLERAYAAVDAIRRFRHLIDHSDCDGIYVPLELEEPISRIGFRDDAEEFSIGSCPSLLRELGELNRVLKVPGDCGQSGGLGWEATGGDPWGAEKWTWSVLHWAARVAVERRLILLFA